MGCLDAEVVPCIAQLTNDAVTGSGGNERHGKQAADQQLKDGFDVVESYMPRRKSKAEIKEWILDIWNRA